MVGKQMLVLRQSCNSRVDKNLEGPHQMSGLIDVSVGGKHCPICGIF